MKLPTKGITVFDHIINLLAYLAGVFVVFIMLNIAADVACRKLVGTSLVWALEFSEYSLLFITFLGAAWLLRREGHPSLDIVVNRLNPGARALVNITMSVLGALLCLVVAGFGTATTWDLFQRGVNMATMLEPPKAPLVAIIPIGSLLLFIQFLRRAHGYLGSWTALRNKA